jgi:O-antigen/teichoic acid export membrane protein
VVLIATIGMAALTPVLLPLLFGDAFHGAIVLTWVLLISTVTGTVSGALLSALGAAGHPGSAARAQLLVLVPTVVALVLLLPSTGALGAAVIATVASFFKLCALLREAPRILGGSLTDYLVIQRADIRSVVLAARRRPKS